MLVVLALLASACTSEVTAAEDPQRTLDDALTALAGYEGLGLGIGLDGEIPSAELASRRIDPASAPLLVGSILEVRSSVADAAHARLLVDDDPDARNAADVAFERLDAVGLGVLVDTVAGGGWVRISTRRGPVDDGDGGGDPIAGELVDATRRLLERADPVTHLEMAADADRLRLQAPSGVVQAWLDDVIEVVSAPGGSGAPPRAGQGGTSNGDSDATVDLWVEDGRLVALEFELMGSTGEQVPEALLVRVSIEEFEAPLDVPGDAPSFALRGLLRDLTSGVGGSADPEVEPTPPQVPDPSDGGATDGGARDGGAPDDGAQDGEATEGEPQPDADGPDRPSEPPSFREEGVFDEAFGDENPFEGDEGFDCVTEDERAQMGEVLGPQAVEELDELIAQGFLVLC